MIYIGCHLSVKDGFYRMGETMKSFGGNTFAYFTRNPRGGKTKDTNEKDVNALRELLDREDFGPLVAHASYTMNLCASNISVRENSIDMLKKDLKKMEYLPGNLYNFHPGAHTGQGSQIAVELISEALNDIMDAGMNTTVLLETMAGKGSEVGRDFEELREIIDRVKLNDRIGVCFDTCHVWDAGYDIVNDPDGVLTRFDKTVGLDRIKAVHLNDSKNECGSHRDRHEKLGYGCIGEEALKRIVRHPSLQGLPFILETPNDDPGYIKEIRAVNGWMVK